MHNDFANILSLMVATIIGMLLVASWYFDYWDWWYALLERLPW